MIKAIAKTPDGEAIVVLGLSRKNCDLLLQGRPIVVRSSDINPERRRVKEILLMAGETEEAIKVELEEFISEKTIVHDRRNEDDLG